MSAVKKPFLIAAALALVICLILQIRQRIQPSYEGRTLHQWLEAYCHASSDYLKTNHQAEVAIQNIGTNAFPLLFEWLDDRSPDRDRSIRDKIGPMFGGRAEKWLSAGDLRAEYARVGFWLLRDRREHAIPRLGAMANNTNDLWAAAKATEVLGEYGLDGINALEPALTNYNNPARGNLLRFIGYRSVFAKTNLSSSIEFVELGLKDPDAQVREIATNTLKNIRDNNSDPMAW